MQEVTPVPADEGTALAAALAWQVAMGADEAVAETPLDWYSAFDPGFAARRGAGAIGFAGGDTCGDAGGGTRLSGLQPGAVAAAIRGLDASAAKDSLSKVARTDSLAIGSGLGERVAALTSLDSLRQALAGLDGCALRLTAMNLVFGEGNPGSGLMLVGEAPGEEEDRQGRPFVGPGGRLLDRMLAAIGLARSSVYLTNLLPWRPPGNRSPTAGEMALCLPFARRHIELVCPKVLILLGGGPAKALLERGEPAARLRGRWFEMPFSGLGASIPTLVTYHPEFLLRSPSHKRDAWLDLLLAKKAVSQ